MTLPESQPNTAERPQRQVRVEDLSNLENFDNPTDQTHPMESFLVTKGNGQVESYLLTAQGLHEPTGLMVGVFERQAVDDDGNPGIETKLIPVEKARADNAAELERRKQEAKELGETSIDMVTTYDYLLDPNYDGGSVKEAAVVREETPDEKFLREMREHNNKLVQNQVIETQSDINRSRGL